jgi:hypothetical protein
MGAERVNDAADIADRPTKTSERQRRHVYADAAHDERAVEVEVGRYLGAVRTAMIWSTTPSMMVVVDDRSATQRIAACNPMSVPRFGAIVGSSSTIRHPQSSNLRLS